MRLAICGIRHETNTFSPLRAGIEDFDVLRGEEILADGPWQAFDSIEWAPTLVAKALPHGLVLREAYEAMAAELVDRLRHVSTVDGVYLDLHGAMEVEGLGDGERDLVCRVRETVGSEIPIVASLDLHANLAREVVEKSNVLTALRTAPHVDRRETQVRAIGHLVRCVKEDIRPANAIVRLPMLLPGEHAATGVEPARSLYAGLRDVEAHPEIMDASIMIGCAWTDSPFTSVAAIVVSENRTAAEEHANRLAQEIWRRRDEFAPDVVTLSVEDVVRRAVSETRHPVFISDSGDNVTAGAAGDIPLVPKTLLDNGARDAVVAGIADARAVQRCIDAGVGAVLTLTVGGKLDRVNGSPLEVTGRVISMNPPRIAVFQVDGVRVVLTADRMPFLDLRAFEEANVNPLEHEIVVVKHGYLAPELREIAGTSLMAVSPGCTTLALEKLSYRRIRRPVFPLDEDVAFSP
ncbi:MAG: M81 family metallopeptidase [Gemmatimonadota bacterium]|nr:M81 family metallopeptidase [Gemmatimonadota bacterium]